MTRAELLQAVEKNRLSGVYVFEGEEENLKHEAMELVKKKLLPEGLEQLNCSVMERPDTQLLQAAAETLPFMSDQRLVVVNEHPGFTARGDADEELLAYLPHVPTSTVLIFYVRGKADKRKKLYTAIKKCGAIISFDKLTEPELARMLCGMFEKLGCQCDAKTASYLVFTSGTDTGLLEQEVGKLAAACGEGGTITTAMIDQLAVRSLECTVFQLTDAVLAGSEKQAFRLLDDLLRNGEERLGILAILLRQYRQLQHIKIMQYEKLPQQEIFNRLGVSGYIGNRILQQAARVSNRVPREAVKICTETEMKVKSGQLNEEGALETALLQIFALTRG